MRQDSRPLLKIHTRNDEPEGLSCLRRLASAAKETEPELAEWLEQAVTDVESGANPKTALSLARRRGRPPTSNRDEWTQIAVGARVSRLREDGLSYEEAVAQVAEERFLSESSVKRCFRKYRPFKQLQDAAEETFGSFKRAIDALAEHSSCQWMEVHEIAADIQRTTSSLTRLTGTILSFPQLHKVMGIQNLQEMNLDIPTFSPFKQAMDALAEHSSCQWMGEIGVGIQQAIASNDLTQSLLDLGKVVAVDGLRHGGKIAQRGAEMALERDAGTFTNQCGNSHGQPAKG